SHRGNAREDGGSQEEGLSVRTAETHQRPLHLELGLPDPDRRDALPRRAPGEGRRQLRGRERDTHPGARDAAENRSLPPRRVSRDGIGRPAGAEKETAPPPLSSDSPGAYGVVHSPSGVTLGPCGSVKRTM